MSDASSTQLFIEEESSWGTTVGSTGQELRFTSESLEHTQQTTTSDEIRSDRQTTDAIRTTIGAEGDINTELSFDAYELLWEGVLMNDFGSLVNINGTDIAATATGFQSDGSPATDLSVVTVGQVIKAEGFSDSTINTWYRVRAKSSTTITTDPAPPTTEASGQSVTLKGSFAGNGTTKKSYTIEKFFSDVTEYQSFTGMRVGQAQFTITPGSIINGSFSFQGKNSAWATSSVFSTTSVAPTNKITNSIDNVKRIVEGPIGSASETSLDINNIQFTITNNLRSIDAIGNLGAIDIGLGRVGVTGQFTALFSANALPDKFVQGTESSLMFVIEDSESTPNWIAFDFPRIVWSRAPVVIGGNDQDVVAAMEFIAVRESTADIMMGITRSAAAS